SVVSTRVPNAATSTPSFQKVYGSEHPERIWPSAAGGRLARRRGRPLVPDQQSGVLRRSDLVVQAPFPDRDLLFGSEEPRFHLAHSHLSDPRRLERLLIATCLAYLWIVCLGAMVVLRGWLPQIHRRDRC